METTQNICKTLGKRLKDFRKQKGLSQEKLAEAADLNTTFVGSIERGQANPTLDTLCKLANALEIEILDLLYSPDTITGKKYRDEKLYALLTEFGAQIRGLYENP